MIPFVGRILRPIRPFIGRNRPFIPKYPSFGFTLVELIVTLVIAPVPPPLSRIPPPKLSAALPEIVLLVMVSVPAL